MLLKFPESIDQLYILYGKSTESFEPELVNPYQYYSFNDLVNLALYRNIKFKENIL